MWMVHPIIYQISRINPIILYRFHLLLHWKKPNLSRSPRRSAPVSHASGDQCLDAPHVTIWGSCRLIGDARPMKNAAGQMVKSQWRYHGISMGSAPTLPSCLGLGSNLSNLSWWSPKWKNGSVESPKILSDKSRFQHRESSFKVIVAIFIVVCCVYHISEVWLNVLSLSYIWIVIHNPSSVMSKWNLWDGSIWDYNSQFRFAQTRGLPQIWAVHIRGWRSSTMTCWGLSHALHKPCGRDLWYQTRCLSQQLFSYKFHHPSQKNQREMEVRSAEWPSKIKLID